MPLESPYIEPPEQHNPDKSAPDLKHEPRIRTRPLDTSEEADRIQMEIYRAMSPGRRLQLAVEASQTSRKLLEQGVRHRHSDYSNDMVRLAVIRLQLGDELFCVAYPEHTHVIP